MTDKALEAARAAYEHYQGVAMDQQHSSVSAYIDTLEASLQAMQARAEKAEAREKALMAERTSIIETKRQQIEGLELSRGAASKVALDAIARAKAAEARVKELEEALERIVSTAKRVDLHKNGALWDLVTPHEIDAAHTALKGGSNG